MRLFRSSALASDSGFKVSQMVGRLCSCAGAMCLICGRMRAFSPAQVSSPAPAAKYPPAREVSRPLSPLHAFLGIDPVTGEFKPPNAVAPKATTPARTADNGTVPSETGAPSEAEADEASSGESPLSEILDAGGRIG